MSKLVSFSNQDVIKGANLLCDTLKSTLGPSGRNVIMDNEFGDITISNDGYTIATRFTLKDKAENAGVMAIRSGIDKMNEISGDGRTTVAVLSQAILNLGNEVIQNTIGVNPVKLRDEIIEAKDEVISKLSPRVCENTYNVAKTSAKSDYLGKLVADIYKKVGKDGIVKLEDGDLEDETIITEGLELKDGVIPESLDDIGHLKDVSVILEDDTLTLKTIKPMLDTLVQAGKTNILIIANDFTKDVVDLIKATKIGKLHIVATKTPGFAKSRVEMFEDVTAVVEANEGLGKIPEIIYDDKSIVLKGGKTEGRIKDLNLLNPESAYDREMLKERIAKLNGKVAIIKVGAQTEVELTEKKHHLKDAINSAKNALEEGVVEGGGLALSKVKIKTDTEGAKVLQEAIKRPYLQIQENGFKFTETETEDSFKVTRTALDNACSVATGILTTGVTLVEDVDEK